MWGEGELNKGSMNLNNLAHFLLYSAMTSSESYGPGVFSHGNVKLIVVECFALSFSQTFVFQWLIFYKVTLNLFFLHLASSPIDLYQQQKSTMSLIKPIRT
jgi:hypothetical protein